MAPPYSVEALIVMISNLSEDRVAQLAIENCLGFELDAFNTLDLVNAGASAELIRRLGQACLGQASEPTPAAPPRTPARVAEPETEEREEASQSARVSRISGPGFYGSNSWFRLHYGMIDETKSGGLSWATMASNFAEFGLWGVVSRTPGFGDLIVWDTDAGLSLNLFLFQPNGRRPLGLYVGGLASFGRSFLADAFGDGINRYMYGWEAGLLGRIGSDELSFIPRAAYRSARHQFASSDVDAEPWTVETIIMGFEAKLQNAVPGVFVHLSDGTRLTILSLTFAF